MATVAVPTVALSAYTLTVHVSPVETGKAKCPVATRIVIKMGDQFVAYGQLGGKYSQSQALSEFRRNPARFKPQGGYESAKAVGLVP